jgi:hypothetical protein
VPGDEHWEFVVTTPAGTTKTAPLNTLTRMPARRIAGISWMIPQGPSGTMGWRFTMGGVQVIPVNIGAWLIRDGNADGSELARLPDSGSWDITSYNTGTVAHALYVTYYATVIRPKPALVVPLGLGSLQPGTDSLPAHH